MQVANTPEQINAFRLLALKGMLTLESKGMKKRGCSALKAVKAEFNLKGTAKTVLPKFIAILKERGILVEAV